MSTEPLTSRTGTRYQRRPPEATAGGVHHVGIRFGVFDVDPHELAHLRDLRFLVLCREIQEGRARERLLPAYVSRLLRRCPHCGVEISLGEK